MTERPRAVFLGSGAFAVPALEVVASASACALVAVITAPARPAGRGGRRSPTPVGERAAALGLTILAPERLRAPASMDILTGLRPDLLVLADYGQIVPAAALALPAHGALNLHPSLLPRHRGASPIPATILAGDAETGVSLMRMDEGLDTGPLIAQVRIRLDGTETAPILEATLARTGADLLTSSLEPWLGGRLATVPQPSAGATMTHPLRRVDGRLDPSRGAALLARMVRAYQPWPGSWFETDDGRVTIWAAQADAGSGPTEAAVGELQADGDGLAIVVADGRLRLLEVQAAGGRRMSGAALRRGHPRLVGSRLADPSLG